MLINICLAPIAVTRTIPIEIKTSQGPVRQLLSIYRVHANFVVTRTIMLQNIGIGLTRISIHMLQLLLQPILIHLSLIMYLLGVPDSGTTHFVMTYLSNL